MLDKRKRDELVGILVELKMLLSLAKCDSVRSSLQSKKDIISNRISYLNYKIDRDRGDLLIECKKGNHIRRFGYVDYNLINNLVEICEGGYYSQI